MDLFIQIQEGKPYEHPIVGDNFRQAFPDIDTNNLPKSFARFVRIDPPVVGVYEIYEGVTYEWSGDSVTDAHHVRAMTAQEKTAKQNKVKADWAEHGYASWIFDEAACAFKSPVPYPTDNKIYRWDEEAASWTSNSPEQF